MWKRILSWQQRQSDSSRAAKPDEPSRAWQARSEREMSEFIAAQKSGVAIQRELAKVMW